MARTSTFRLSSQRSQTLFIPPIHGLIEYSTMTRQTSLLSFFGNQGKPSDCSERKNKKRQNDDVSKKLVNSKTRKKDNRTVTSNHMDCATIPVESPVKDESSTLTDMDEDKFDAESKIPPPITSTAELVSSSSSDGDDDDASNASNANDVLDDAKDVIDDANDDENDEDDEDYKDGNDKDTSQVLSEYELLRLRNIQRNNARLVALGLLSTGSTSNSSSTNDMFDLIVGQRQQKTRIKQSTNRRKRCRVTGNDHMKDRNHPTPPTRRSTRLRRKSVSQSSGSTSKSIVLHDGSTGGLDEENDDTIHSEQPEILKETYTVSPLMQYDMDMTDHHAECGRHAGETSTSPFRCEIFNDHDIDEYFDEGNLTLTPMSVRLRPPKGLSAIYSLNFFNNNNMEGGGEGRTIHNDWKMNHDWLVGAGKSGIVSIWKWSKNMLMQKKQQQDEEIESQGIDPLLSWKAHGGRWVAEARFLPSSSSSSTSASATTASTTTASTSTSPTRLITAGNDGCVCLWDVTAISTQTGSPRLMARTNKSLHTSGIFSMDVYTTTSHRSSNNYDTNNDALVCTGSKDKTVAVTQLEDLVSTSTTKVLWRSTCHSSKVSTVKFKYGNSSLLASASSGDGTAIVQDYRVPGNTTSTIVTKLDEANNQTHSVIWHPYDENVLLTAGLDECIKIWDIRKTSQPTDVLHGHVPTSIRRVKRIHHPIFYFPNSTKMFNGSSHTTSTNRNKYKDEILSYLLTGGEGSNSISIFKQGTLQNNDKNGNDDKNNSSNDKNNNNNSTSSNAKYLLQSRGKLPTDCGDAGCIAVQSATVAVSVDDGEVLLLHPPRGHHGQSKY